MQRRTIGFESVGVGLDTRSVLDWLKMAGVLERSYRAVLREAQHGLRRLSSNPILGSASPGSEVKLTGRQKVSLRVTLEKAEMMKPAAMLAAMSIECSLKAIIAISKKPPKTHRLSELAQSAGLQLSGSKAETLGHLAAMIQLGRYHIDSNNTTRSKISPKGIDVVVNEVREHATARCRNVM